MGELRFSMDGKYGISFGLQEKSISYNLLENTASWMLVEQRMENKQMNYLAMRLMAVNLAN